MVGECIVRLRGGLTDDCPHRRPQRIQRDNLCIWPDWLWKDVYNDGE